MGKNTINHSRITFKFYDIKHPTSNTAGQYTQSACTLYWVLSGCMHAYNLHAQDTPYSLCTVTSILTTGPGVLEKYQVKTWEPKFQILTWDFHLRPGLESLKKLSARNSSQISSHPLRCLETWLQLCSPTCSCFLIEKQFIMWLIYISKPVAKILLSHIISDNPLPASLDHFSVLGKRPSKSTCTEI